MGELGEGAVLSIISVEGGEEKGKKRRGRKKGVRVGSPCERDNRACGDGSKRMSFAT